MTQNTKHKKPPVDPQPNNNSKMSNSSGLELTHGISTGGEYFALNDSGHFDDRSREAAQETRIVVDAHGQLSYEQGLSLQKLDVYLQRVYTYFADHGYAFMIGQRVAEVCSLAFLILAFLFTGVCVRWRAFWNCGRKTPGFACDQWSDFVDLTPSPGTWTVSGYFVVVSCLCLSVYLVAQIVSTRTLQLAAGEIRRFYTTQMHIADESIEMGTVLFPTVIDRMVELQSRSLLPMIQHSLTPLTIVNRVMRSGNLLIAMMQPEHDVFQLHNQKWCDLGSRLPLWLTSRLPPLLFDWCHIKGEWLFSSRLHSALDSCVFRFILNNNCQLDMDFLDPSGKSIRRSMKRTAIYCFFTAFLALPYALVEAFIRHVQDFYIQRNLLGNRRWTLYAQWRLREYNELPHTAQHRLDVAQKYAQKYLDQYPNYLVSQVFQVLLLVSGAFVSLLLIFTLLDSNVMIDIHVFNYSLLWYFGLFVGSAMMCRTYVVSGVSAAKSRYPRKTYNNLVKYMRYTPSLRITTAPVATMASPRLGPSGGGGPHVVSMQTHMHLYLQEMKRTLETFYRHKLSIIVQEICGIVVTPFVLWWMANHLSPSIAAFVLENSYSSPELGVVCKHAMFRATNDNAPNGAPVMQHAQTIDDNIVDAPNIMVSSIDDETDEPPIMVVQKTSDKMTSSLDNFTLEYPSWKAPVVTTQARTGNALDMLRMRGMTSSANSLVDRMHLSFGMSPT
mgnify:CR=1 FL=1